MKEVKKDSKRKRRRRIKMVFLKQLLIIIASVDFCNSLKTEGNFISQIPEITFHRKLPF